jgi:hypothetical protein
VRAPLSGANPSRLFHFMREREEAACARDPRELLVLVAPRPSVSRYGPPGRASQSRRTPVEPLDGRREPSLLPPSPMLPPMLPPSSTSLRLLPPSPLLLGSATAAARFPSPQPRVPSRYGAACRMCHGLASRRARGSHGSSEASRSALGGTRADCFGARRRERGSAQEREPMAERAGGQSAEGEAAPGRMASEGVGRGPRGAEARGATARTRAEAPEHCGASRRPGRADRGRVELPTVRPGGAQRRLRRLGLEVRARRRFEPQLRRPGFIGFRGGGDRLPPPRDNFNARPDGHATSR